MSDDELEALQDALGDLGERVSEFLVEETDTTPEEFDAAVAEYPLPDPSEDRSIDDE